MLYEQIRYAEEIRKLYRLRHILTHRPHPAIDSLLGYSKKDTQFRRIKKTLQKERVLGQNGRFVENEPNLWMAELALFASKDQTKTLGHRIPYSIFLVASLQPAGKVAPANLSKDLLVSRQTIRYSLNELIAVNILKSENQGTMIADDKLRRWLVKYIDLAKSYADVTGDISYLFNTVPAHIGGPAAFYSTNYEPGRPIGRSEIEIETYKPFSPVWKSLTQDVRYFKEYPKQVRVEIASPNEDLVWSGGIPYHRVSSIRKGEHSNG